MSLTNALTYLIVRAEGKTAELRGTDDDTADLLLALSMQLRRSLIDATAAREVAAEMTDSNRMLSRDAARWRAIEPLLTLDEDADPTATRIAALVSLRAPGVLADAGEVVDYLVEKSYVEATV